MIFKRFKFNCCGKSFCTVVKHDVNESHSKFCSKAIRKHFIDYYVNEHNHTFVPSSSVVSYTDITLPFVNAGMCQFKNVFLGREKPSFPSAANSQKCIRINDLNVIGDSYHHTFFEMLGSWSFGTYFKKEACELAWNLLTEPPFSISRDRLFVTYFSGNRGLSLPPDNETRDIWASLGVPGNRIVPSGMKDNFWDMGLTGPCGPCTEIHIALTDNLISKSKLLNTGHPLLTELWNIVFISYNREENNNLVPLKSEFVDTGMGFERLVSVLQEQVSTYDTDLFTPLFHAISRITDAPPYVADSPLCKSYRILADHARMVTVAIADNAFPETDHKVRKLLRKAMLTARKDFNVSEPDYLISELSNYVADSLSDAYPNIFDNLPKVKYIIQYESELLKQIIDDNKDDWITMVAHCPSLDNYIPDEYPTLPQAFNHVSKLADTNINTLPAKEACFLHENWGLDREIINKLSNAFGLHINWTEVDYLMDSGKSNNSSVERTQSSLPSGFGILNKSVKRTDDTYKYEYERMTMQSGVKYEFPEISGLVQAIVNRDHLIESQISEHFHTSNIDTSSISPEVRLDEEEHDIEIITDKTNFYTKAGGQSSDSGKAIITNRHGQRITFLVTGVRKQFDYVLHRLKIAEYERGKYPDLTIAAGDQVTLMIDEERRLCHMRNHTLVHLINACLKKLLPVVCPRSAKFDQVSSTITTAIFSARFGLDELVKLENAVNDIIRSSLPVKRYTVSGFQLNSSTDISLTPGVTYPSENIHIISIENGDKVISKEACCGTHVLNTEDIGPFCFTSLNKTITSHPILTCMTGDKVETVLNTGEKYLEKISNFSRIVDDTLNRDNHTFKDVEAVHKAYLSTKYDYKNHLKIQSPQDGFCLIHNEKISDMLENVGKRIKTELLSIARKTAEDDLKLLLKDQQGNSVKYLIHVLDIKDIFHEYISLRELINVCKHIPTTLFLYKKGRLRSCCQVPENLVTAKFSAVKWMAPICEAINAKPPFCNRHQDIRQICFMHPLTVKSDNLPSILRLASKMATDTVVRYY